LYDINIGGISLSESLQEATIIEKLSPSWKDFKNYFKHKLWGLGYNRKISYPNEEPTLWCPKIKCHGTNGTIP